MENEGEDSWDPNYGNQLEEENKDHAQENAGRGRGLLNEAFQKPFGRGANVTSKGRARGRARGGAGNRSLDLCNLSVFNPGGSSEPAPERRSVMFALGVVQEQVEVEVEELNRLKRKSAQLQRNIEDLHHQGHVKRCELDEARAMLFRKGEELEETDETMAQKQQALSQAREEFAQINDNMNLLVRARNSQVEDNEMVRRGIVDETFHMNRKRDELINDVADLTARKSLLDTYLKRAHEEITSDHADSSDASDLSSIISDQSGHLRLKGCLIVKTRMFAHHLM